MEIIIAKGVKINLWSLKFPIIVEVNGLVRTILLLCWYCYVVDVQKTSNSLVFFSNYLLEENIPNLGMYIDFSLLVFWISVEWIFSMPCGSVSFDNYGFKCSFVNWSSSF